mmetsp:Transcript_1563/g.9625  ORF Transcript_1563/g.9625 Transcript_1563/m.9625 type:complete len:238 (-) Transcript_1563:1313-2026(-)
MEGATVATSTIRDDAESHHHAHRRCETWDACCVRTWCWRLRRHWKGETAVPTKGMLREQHPTARCLLDRNPIHVTSGLDERMTSKTRHKCGGRMNDVKDVDGRVVRGIKLCGCCGDVPRAHVLWPDTNSTCSYYRRPTRGLRSDGQTLQGLRWCTHTRDEMHIGKLRNRDVNVAKNLWKVLFALSNDQPRPHHLCRSRKTNEDERRAKRPKTNATNTSTNPHVFLPGDIVERSAGDV